MDYSVTIDQFEGPMDLLLHLIKESKISILEIKVDEITNQYLSYIQKMDELNLTIASEYLVMASELIEMKSKSLLPKRENDSLEEEEDDRTILIDRLLAYQQYKELTKVLKEKEELRKEIYTKAPSNMKEYMEDATLPIGSLSLDDLLSAFHRFLEQQEKNKPLYTKVTKREMSVEERRKEIKEVLKKEKRVSFFSLFPVPTREYIVVTFLAILEMAKQSEIVITQEEDFKEIICEVVG